MRDQDFERLVEHVQKVEREGGYVEDKRSFWTRLIESIKFWGGKEKKNGKTSYYIGVKGGTDF